MNMNNDSKWVCVAFVLIVAIVIIAEVIATKFKQDANQHMTQRSHELNMQAIKSAHDVEIQTLKLHLDMNAKTIEAQTKLIEQLERNQSK